MISLACSVSPTIPSSAKSASSTLGGCRLSHRKSGVGAGRPTKLPPMPWGTRAAETYFAFSRRLDKLIDTDPRRDELSRRGAENAVRLATIVAVGRGSSTVDREDIEWAIKLAERSIEAAAGGIERYMREYLDFPKFCERLLAKITACGGFRSESELRRATSATTKSYLRIRQRNLPTHKRRPHHARELQTPSRAGSRRLLRSGSAMWRDFGGVGGLGG